MSIETWKPEFYPIPADDKRLRTRVACLEHSIRKWIGLRETNLEKHGCTFHIGTGFVEFHGGVYGKFFFVDDSSCALCVRWYQRDGRCRPCPIVRVTGRTCQTAWAPWIRHGDPEPMIRLLRKVLRSVKAELAAKREKKR